MLLMIRLQYLLNEPVLYTIHYVSFGQVMHHVYLMIADITEVLYTIKYCDRKRKQRKKNFGTVLTILYSWNLNISRRHVVHISEYLWLNYLRICFQLEAKLGQAVSSQFHTKCSMCRVVKRQIWCIYQKLLRSLTGSRPRISIGRLHRDVLSNGSFSAHPHACFDSV